MKTEYLAVMFTDIKGFTSSTSHKSREEIDALLEVHDSLIRPVFKEFNGNIIKTIGDAFLVTFKSPTDAVLCGIKIQDVLEDYNNTDPSKEPLLVRVAINAGEVNIRNGDVFGEPVNIASRIESIAEPGRIYFTEAVYLSMNKREIPSAEIGHRHLKGIPHEIKVYKVLKEGETAAPVRTNYAAPKPSRKKWVFGAIAILVVFFILANVGKNNPDSMTTVELPEFADQENPEFIEPEPPVDEGVQASIDTWIFLVDQAMENRDRQMAEELIRKLEEAPPEFQEALPPNAFTQAARLHYMIDDPEGAVHYLWRTVDMNPEDPGLWNEIRHLAEQCFEWERPELIGHCEEIIQISEAQLR